MKNIRLYLSIIVFMAGLGLVACNSAQQQSAPATMADQSNTAAGMSTSLTAEQAKVSLTVGTPTVTADGKSLVVPVTLTNNGGTTLVSAGKYPVTISGHAIDANGRVVVFDLPRANISATPPGGHATTNLMVPVDQIRGRRIQLFPVQEGVAWFDHWGFKPIVIGPFDNCAAPNQDKLCNTGGTALASQNAGQ